MKGVAISGRAGSGKSTLAGLLVDLLTAAGRPARRVSFGDALKREVYTLYGLTKDDPGGRAALVEWGERMRTRDPLYWVNHFASAARTAAWRGEIVVCDDMRFLSELGWCVASGYDTVRLDVPRAIAAARIPQPPDPNSSGETELDPWTAWDWRFVDYDGKLSLPFVASYVAGVRPNTHVVSR